MNIIRKKQPHSVGIAISGGVHNALKIGFMAQAIKQFNPHTRVYLFLNAKGAKNLQNLLGFDKIKSFKNNFFLKMFLRLKGIKSFIDLRGQKNERLILEAVKQLKNEGIELVTIDQKIKVDAQKYLDFQNELLNIGLVPKNYLVFYNGYEFMEEVRFKNKQWPFEKEFLQQVLKTTNYKILYLSDTNHCPVEDKRIVFLKLPQNLEKLVVYLEKSVGFVGVENFLSLIAAQLGIPTVILNGPGQSHVLATKKVIALNAQIPCAPCHNDFRCKDNVCMKTFSPLSVQQKFDELVSIV